MTMTVEFGFLLALGLVLLFAIIGTIVVKRSTKEKKI